MNTLKEFLSIKDYFYASVSAFLGVIIGVLWTEYKWRQDQRAMTQNHRVKLVKSFRFALGGIEKCLEFLRRPEPMIPNFKLDTSTIGYILFSGRDLFSDETLFDRFNWQRYQLDHINAKLDYIHIYFTSIDDSHKSLVRHEYDSLVSHLETTQKEISKLIADYENNFQCNRQTSVFSRIFLKFYRKWFEGIKP